MTDIIEFYKDTTILITGGTGFLGKVLIEKLLRTCNVKTIILLVRVKNSLTVEDRLTAFLQDSIFERLQREAPEAMRKVIAIKVDYNAFDLDINVEEKQQIVKEVNIVFNVVASVKFNEKLQDAFNINVNGTKKVVNLTLEITNLKAFLHVSTLYSNCHLKVIEEKVYEPDICYEKMLEITRVMDDVCFERIHHCLVQPMPNTYTMTKNCAENLVNCRTHQLPAGIFRPPIVLSTYREPVPGWTDNINGPSSICTWSAKGIVHCIFGDAHKNAHLVPADYCINAIIAAAWDANQRYDERKITHDPIPVYNYSFAENCLTWGSYMRLSRDGYSVPFKETFWSFSYIIIRNRIIFNVAEFLLHTLPGYILDLIAAVTGHKRIYSKSYKKLERVLRMMSYFGLREWTCSNDNIKSLSKKLKDYASQDNGDDSSEATADGCDKFNFLEFNIETIDWKEYFASYLLGIKKYFFKENFDRTNQIKRQYKRLYWIHCFTKFVFWFLLSTKCMRILRHVCTKFLL